MTWRQWCASVYNTKGARIIGNYVFWEAISPDEDAYVYDYTIGVYDYVRPDDIIVSTNEYEPL